MEESKEKWICLNCGKENEKEVQKCLYCKISKPTPLKVRKGKDNPKTLVQINTLEKITEEEQLEGDIIQIISEATETRRSEVFFRLANLHNSSYRAAKISEALARLTNADILKAENRHVEGLPTCFYKLNI